MPSSEIVLEVKQVAEGVRLYCKAKPIFDWLDTISRDFSLPPEEAILWERKPVRKISTAPAPLRDVRWDGWGQTRLIEPGDGMQKISLAWLRAQPNDEGEIEVLIKDPHGRKTLEDFLDRAKRCLHKLWNGYCQPYEGRVTITRMDVF